MDFDFDPSAPLAQAAPRKIPNIWDRTVTMCRKRPTALPKVQKVMALLRPYQNILLSACCLITLYTITICIFTNLIMLKLML